MSQRAKTAVAAWIAVCVLGSCGRGDSDANASKAAPPSSSSEGEAELITPEQALAEYVQSLGGRVGGPAAVVDLEHFFLGNDDPASIAPNLEPHPGVQQIYDVLRRLRDDPAVSTVMVSVLLEWDTQPPNEWPFAESVLVVTSLSPEAVDAIVRTVGADPTSPEQLMAGLANPPIVPEGQRALTVWWD